MFTFLLRSARDLMVSVVAVDAVTRRRVARRARAGTELWDGRIASEDTEPGQHRRHRSVSVLSSAANRLIGEVVQSRRRPLLGPSPG